MREIDHFVWCEYVNGSTGHVWCEYVKIAENFAKSRRPSLPVDEPSGEARAHDDGPVRPADFHTRFDDPVADALMGSVMVIPVAVLSQRSAKRSFTKEPEVVGAFLLDAAQHALGVGVHVRRARRGEPDGDAAAGENGVETGLGEGSIAIVDEEPRVPSIEDAIRHRELPGDVGHHGLIGMLRDGGDMDAAVGKVGSATTVGAAGYGGYQLGEALFGNE